MLGELRVGPATMFLPATALLTRLRNAAFLRNILVVMTGSAISQAIAFGLSPLVSRLFTPTDFGVFGSFVAVTTVIGAIVTLDYSQAIMLPKRREDAADILVLCVVVTVAVTAVCGLFCVLFPGWLFALLKTHDRSMLALLVLAVLSLGLSSSFQAWCVRAKSFTHVSISQALRGGSSNGLQVGLGVLKAGAGGLIFSTVAADLLSAAYLFLVARGDVGSVVRHLRWHRVKELAAEFRDFPIYSSSVNGANALSQSLPVVLLAHFYGIHVAGAYAFGMRILAAPVNLVTNAMRQVLFQKACETHNTGRALLPLYLSTTGGLFALAFLPSLVLFVWSPAIFGFIFGAQWWVAGEYVRWLVAWQLFAFCNVPAVLFSRVIRIQHKMVVFQVALLSGRALALVLGGMYLTAVQTIVAFSAVGAVVNAIAIVFVACAVKRDADGRARSGDGFAVRRTGRDETPGWLQSEQS